LNACIQCPNLLKRCQTFNQKKTFQNSLNNTCKNKIDSIIILYSPFDIDTLDLLYLKYYKKNIYVYKFVYDSQNDSCYYCYCDTIRERNIIRFFKNNIKQFYISKTEKVVLKEIENKYHGDIPILGVRGYKNGESILLEYLIMYREATYNPKFIEFINWILDVGSISCGSGYNEAKWRSK
jgi:hypothetical protein